MNARDNHCMGHCGLIRTQAVSFRKRERDVERVLHGSSIINTGETAGKGVKTYLILKQLSVHNPRTALRGLTDVAAKEYRLTSFQRLLQTDQPETSSGRKSCNDAMKHTFTTAFFKFSISVLTSRYLLARTTTNEFLTNRGQICRPRHSQVCLLYTALSRHCGDH